MAEKVLKTNISLRNDTAANWTSVDPVLIKGEVGIEIDTLKSKIGDGVTSWSQLKYSNIPYEDLFDSNGKIKTDLLDSDAVGHKTVLFEATNDTPDSKNDTTVISEYFSTTPDPAAQQGDIFIVKNLIADSLYQYTGYIYTGTEWKALDGNYNADNVYLDSDLVITANIGVQTIDSSGSKTLDTAGKSLKQVLDMIVASEKNPTITQPSVSVACPEAKAYEVGTTVTPTYSATLNPGKYQYGPATGITPTSWNVTDTDSGSSTDASGSFSEITVGDSTSYRITAVAQYGDGAIPKTNLGNDYEAGKIAAGSKTGNSGYITGYRSFFYGVLDTSSSEAPLTSAIIRGLTNGGALTGNKTLTVNSHSGAKRVVVAIKADNSRNVTSAILTSSMNADITTEYVKQSDNVDVEGVNSYTAAAYKVWVYEPASMDASEVHSISIS